MSEFLAACEQAARLGGEILQSWRTRFTAREKGPSDLVTEADFASQKAIQEFLAGKYPDFDFLGEESTAAEKTARKSEYRWIVDPLETALPDLGLVPVTDGRSTLSVPTADAGFRGHIDKSSVAIVFEKMRHRLLARGKSIESRTVHQKNVEPAVVVVIIESDAAAGCLEQIFVFVFAAEERLDVESGILRDVDEADAEVAWLRGGSGSSSRGLRRGGQFCASEQRAGQRKHIFKGENQRGPAQRTKE